MSKLANEIALSKPSSSSNELRNKRKRYRSCETTDQVILGLQEETQSPNKDLSIVGFSWNCPIHDYGHNKLMQELQYKETSNLVKNYDQKARQSISETQRNIRDDSKEAKLDDFLTKIDNAITRIESLIPTLEKLFCSDPTNHVMGVEISTNLDADAHLTNTKGRSKECKSPVVGRNMLCKQGNLMLTKCDNVALLPKRDENKLPNRISSQNMIDKPLNWISTQDKSPSSFCANLEKNLPCQRSQIAGVKTRTSLDRVESLKCTLSRNSSVKSQAPEHIQGLRIMPCLFNMDNLDQNQMCNKEGTVKNAVLRPQTQVPSVGSTNFLRPNRNNNMGNSGRNLSQCHTRGSTSLEKSRPSQRIQFSDRANRSTILVQSDSDSSSSGTYQSTSSASDGSYESEVQYGQLGWSSSRKQHGASDSTSGYDTSSYYGSQDCYSDAVSSSQSSPTWSRDHDLKRAKRVGRLKRLKKKLGMIFHHHHHHHHHHYGGSDESDVGHGGSFWRHIGKMFHRRRKSDGKKSKVDKSSKTVTKSVPNRKQQGHFHGLVQGLMRHLRHSKKSKKAKDNFVRLGNSQRRGKKAVNELPWWPKIKEKGGVKVSNKGRLKLKNRKERFPLAAAKLILRE